MSHLKSFAEAKDWLLGILIIGVFGWHASELRGMRETMESGVKELVAVRKDTDANTEAVKKANETNEAQDKQIGENMRSLVEVRTRLDMRPFSRNASR